jgi:hypothetical protein
MPSQGRIAPLGVLLIRPTIYGPGLPNSLPARSLRVVITALQPRLPSFARDGEEPASGYHWDMFGWRGEVREQIAQLEDQRTLLEEVRLRARRQGGPEGGRLEAQAKARLREIEQQIADLRASLE